MMKLDLKGDGNTRDEVKKLKEGEKMVAKRASRGKGASGTHTRCAVLGRVKLMSSSLSHYCHDGSDC